MQDELKEGDPDSLGMESGLPVSGMHDPASFPLETRQSSANSSGQLDSGTILFSPSIRPGEVLTCVFLKMCRRHWGICLCVRFAVLCISIEQLESYAKLGSK